ncbi:hypothetical protein D3C75_524980 [compost metagenome]
MDGDLHKRRGVIRIDYLQPLREKRLQLCQLGFDRRRGIQRIGTGCQLDPQPGRRLTIDFGDHIVVLAAGRNPGHIFQMHHRPVLIHLQGDVAKLFSRFQSRLGDD